MLDAVDKFGYILTSTRHSSVKARIGKAGHKAAGGSQEEDEGGTIVLDKQATRKKAHHSQLLQFDWKTKRTITEKGFRWLLSKATIDRVNEKVIRQGTSGPAMQLMLVYDNKSREYDICVNPPVKQNLNRCARQGGECRTFKAVRRTSFDGQEGRCIIYSPNVDFTTCMSMQDLARSLNNLTCPI